MAAEVGGPARVGTGAGFGGEAFERSSPNSAGSRACPARRPCPPSCPVRRGASTSRTRRRAGRPGRFRGEYPDRGVSGAVGSAIVAPGTAAASNRAPGWRACMSARSGVERRPATRRAADAANRRLDSDHAAAPAAAATPQTMVAACGREGRVESSPREPARRTPRSASVATRIDLPSPSGRAWSAAAAQAFVHTTADRRGRGNVGIQLGAQRAGIAQAQRLGLRARCESASQREGRGGKSLPAPRRHSARRWSTRAGVEAGGVRERRVETPPPPPPRALTQIHGEGVSARGLVSERRIRRERRGAGQESPVGQDLDPRRRPRGGAGQAAAARRPARKAPAIIEARSPRSRGSRSLQFGQGLPKSGSVSAIASGARRVGAHGLATGHRAGEPAVSRRTGNGITVAGRMQRPQHGGSPPRRSTRVAAPQRRREAQGVERRRASHGQSGAMCGPSGRNEPGRRLRQPRAHTRQPAAR